VRKDLRKFSQDDAESFFYWLQQTPKYTDDTKKDFWNQFRILAEFLNPDVKIRDFKLKLNLKRKLPEEILTEEEILLLKKNARTIRNRALVSILAETGMRVGELMNLRLKDISFDEYGAVLFVQNINKTGARRIRIVNSAQILALYLEEHRHLGDSEAPVFYRTDKHYKQKLTNTGINTMLKSVALRAGIQKRIYPHLFRHSRATHLANKLTEQQLKAYLGWAGDSRMAATYVHLSGKDIDDAILHVNGIKTKEEESSPLDLRTCPRCQERNDASLKYCGRCGNPLEEDASIPAEKPIEDNGFQEFLMDMYRSWKNGKF